MKKILSLLIAVLLCAAIFTGCATKPAAQDPYELYVLATKNSSVENITSLEAKMTMNMKMVMGEEVVDTDVVVDVQALIVSETDMQMAMSMNMEIPEMGAVPLTMYYKEGFAYTEMMGMKMKTAMPIDQMMQSQNLNLTSSDDILAKEDIKEATITETEKGTLINLTISDKAMMNQIAAGGASSMIDSLGEDASFEIGEVKMGLLIDKDNKIVEQTMVFSMTMTVEGETVNVDYDMTMGEMKYNTITEIAFPEDLDTYMEIAQ